MKNLSNGDYTPSVEHNPSMSVYTPSAFQSASNSKDTQTAVTTVTKPTTHLNGTTTGNWKLEQREPPAGNVASNNSTAGGFDTSSLHPEVRDCCTKDTGSFAVRQTANPTPLTKEGGRDPETGLYPSPTHAVRNQFGNSRAMANSSYDLRADNVPESFSGQGANLAPEVATARPYTAIQGVTRLD